MRDVRRLADPAGLLGNRAYETSADLLGIVPRDEVLVRQGCILQCLGNLNQGVTPGDGEHLLGNLQSAGGGDTEKV
jgi:hypothetical protein